MKKYLDYIFAGVIAATAFQFYYTWVERLGASYLRDVVYSQDGRLYIAC